MEVSYVTLPNANFVTSKIAPQERWLKLYRKIHNLYLKDEFIHKQDYLLTLNQLNARITAVETAMNAGFVALKASTETAILTHIHTVPQAPAGALPSGPGTPLASLPAAVPSAAPVVQHMTTFMDQTDLALQATGPAQAPLGDGASVTALQATRTAVSQVGA